MKFSFNIRRPLVSSWSTGVVKQIISGTQKVGNKGSEMSQKEALDLKKAMAI